MQYCQDIKPKTGYVFKTLLLGGEDFATRFFCQQASVKTFAGEYKRSVGVGLGVHSCEVNDTRVRMQLWDIAVSDARWAPIRTMFRGGHAAIYVVNAERLESLRYLRQDVKHYCGRIPEIFLFYGSTRNIMQIKRKLGRSNFLGLVTSGEALDELAEMMFNSSLYESGVPPFRFAALEIPLKKMVESQRALPSSSTPHILRIMSPELIDTVQASGFENEGTIVTIQAYDAVFQVNLISGSVRFSPFLCHGCSKGSRKWTNLCLVAAGPGWSNTSMNQRDLEILSKIHAIASESLPKDRDCIVSKAVSAVEGCRHFKAAPLKLPVPDPIEEILDMLIDSTSPRPMVH